MPGANERALEKAQTIPADALILDLEDAVAPDAKPEAARARAAPPPPRAPTAAARSPSGPTASAPPWHDDDLAAIAAAGPAAVVSRRSTPPPRCTRSRRPSRPAGRRTAPGSGRCSRRPIAMLTALEIASRVRPARGARDGHQRPGQGAPGRRTCPAASRCCRASGLCLLAARAAGKVILDGVYNDIKDDAGFLAECEQGRDLGFDGKTLIHPSQVEPCNAHLRPDRRRGRAGRPHHRRLRGGRGRRAGRRHRRRPHGGEPARRAGPPHPRHPAEAIERR